MRRTVPRGQLNGSRDEIAMSSTAKTVLKQLHAQLDKERNEGKKLKERLYALKSSG